MNTYRVVNKFECDGESWVTVMLDGAACIMPECDYERIIKTEKRSKYKRH